MSQVVPDRRERRTRKALVSAFVGLLGQRRYDEIQVGEIAQSADVGRSTFYAHYRGKDELLFDSMGWIFDILGDSVREDGDAQRLTFMAAHMWENRGLGRRVMAGPRAPLATPRGVRRLADAIETMVDAEDLTLALPARLVAIQIAEVQLGLLRSWFLADAEATAAEIGAALRSSARGLLLAARAD